MIRHQCAADRANYDCKLRNEMMLKLQNIKTIQFAAPTHHWLATQTRHKLQPFQAIFACLVFLGKCSCIVPSPLDPNSSIV